MEATERTKNMEIMMRDLLMEFTSLHIQIESLQEQLEAKERENEELRGLAKC